MNKIDCFKGKCLVNLLLLNKVRLFVIIFFFFIFIEGRVKFLLGFNIFVVVVFKVFFGNIFIFFKFFIFFFRKFLISKFFIFFFFSILDVLLFIVISFIKVVGFVGF